MLLHAPAMSHLSCGNSSCICVKSVGWNRLVEGRCRLPSYPGSGFSALFITMATTYIYVPVISAGAAHDNTSHFHSSATWVKQTPLASLIAVDEQSFTFVPCTLRHLFIQLSELIWRLSLLENWKMISGFIWSLCNRHGEEKNSYSWERIAEDGTSWGKQQAAAISVSSEHLEHVRLGGVCVCVCVYAFDSWSVTFFIQIRRSVEKKETMRTTRVLKEAPASGRESGCDNIVVKLD